MATSLVRKRKAVYYIKKLVKDFLAVCGGNCFLLSCGDDHLLIPQTLTFC